MAQEVKSEGNLKAYNALGGKELDSLMGQVRSVLKDWQQQLGLSELMFTDIKIFYDDEATNSE